ncbi:SO_0444 family Cu/Zn efflux transporter [Desulfuromonas sp. AOP6]|uniref:SO_0444 family Cu/Zn efflux transporter n=1 Tax=Desulfuromonas sp. AOP6 TaxID=1566351 RepID=UPI0012DC18C6|nr:SO_0444 family Cu/Zn efflux transporter [Desulfuromonas sp. AOP6]
MDIVLGILGECWEILVESAVYVLFGFFAAGVLKALIPTEVVARHLGKSSAGSVLKASLFGVPLPLCSCGVIPAAIGLRQQGASKGASAAFLVSVPETGVDSMAITWALLDPLMTLIRPLAAFVTATVTGLAINRLPDKTPPAEDKAAASLMAGQDAAERHPLSRRLREGIAYAFGDLLGDIGKWLLLGIGLAGIIAYFVPDDFFVRYLHSELLSLLIMLAVGIPLYICASASTPIAAALVLKGLSPGAALVFLLAGPATNAATITVVFRYFGRAATLTYLASIALCSLVLGWLTNRLYAFSGLDISRWVSEAGAATESPLMVAAAVVLLLLLGRCSLQSRKKDNCSCPDGPPGST